VRYGKDGFGRRGASLWGLGLKRGWGHGRDGIQQRKPIKGLASRRSAAQRRRAAVMFG